jgi:hypothetical protein
MGPFKTIELNVRDRTVLSDQLYYTTDNRTSQLGALSGNYDEGQFLGRVKLSQNNTRLINIGENWATKETTREWLDITISSDGKYQTACTGSRFSPTNTYYIYRSDNYGNTWTQVGPQKAWHRVKMSSDGKYQVAGTRSNTTASEVYVSTDYGNTWVQRNPISIGPAGAPGWNVTISSDGQYIIAAHTLSQQFLYISRNYGVTWSQKSWSITPVFQTGISEVAISSDGRYQAILTNSSGGTAVGGIRVSKDYGETWSAQVSGLVFFDGRGIVISSDGKYMVAGGFNWPVTYRSSNYGDTWETVTGTVRWTSLAMSSDGKYVVGTTSNDQIYISTDYGYTWKKRGPSGSSAIAISTDGKYICVVKANDTIYISVADELIDGNLSATNVIYASGGNSNQWNSAFTTIQNTSASWEESADIIPTVTNYLSTNNVQISALTIINTLSTINSLTVAGIISGSNLRTSFNEGFATGNSSFAVNRGNATGNYSHAENEGLAVGVGSHAEGLNAIAAGSYSHAEGRDVVAVGVYSHAEGNSTIAYGNNSHTEGNSTFTGRRFTFVNVLSTSIANVCIFTFAPNVSGEFNYISPGFVLPYNFTYPFGTFHKGILTVTNRSTTTGTITGTILNTSNNPSPTIGGYTPIDTSIIGGYNTQLGAVLGSYAHAEGTFTISTGVASHAEGSEAQAFGSASHAEGEKTIATGPDSHAEGYGSRAIGGYSHAAGLLSVASQDNTFIWRGMSFPSLNASLVGTTRTGQFMVSAEGGIVLANSVGINTDNNSNALTVAGSISATSATIATNLSVGGTVFSIGSADVLGKYTEIIGNGTNFTVTHNLSTTEVQVQVYKVSDGTLSYPTIEVTSVNAIAVKFAQTIPAASYRVIVHGSVPSTRITAYAQTFYYLATGLGVLPELSASWQASTTVVQNNSAVWTPEELAIAYAIAL